MKMSAEGLALIRDQEGFRGQAYRDAAGVWTIGFGHTSMAGPPEVKPDMRMSRTEAEAVLARDVTVGPGCYIGATAVVVACLNTDVLRLARTVQEWRDAR